MASSLVLVLVFVRVLVFFFYVHVHVHVYGYGYGILFHVVGFRVRKEGRGSGGLAHVLMYVHTYARWPSLSWIGLDWMGRR